MKQHLNTLYVMTQGAYLAAERETAVVKVGDDVRLRVPLHLLEGIVSFGRTVKRITQRYGGDITATIWRTSIVITASPSIIV